MKVERKKGWMEKGNKTGKNKLRKWIRHCRDREEEMVDMRKEGRKNEKRQDKG